MKFTSLQISGGIRLPDVCARRVSPADAIGGVGWVMMHDMTVPHPSDSDPPIGPTSLRRPSPTRARRWLGPVAAGLMAAAAVVGLVLVVSRDTPTTVPATDLTLPAVTTTVAPGSTVAPTDVTTVPDAATTTQPPDTAPPDTTTPPVVPDVPTAVVTAGADGVWVVDPDGTRVQWWDQPAAFAVRSPDGSLIVQIHLRGDACTLDGTCTAADTSPLRLVGPNAYPVILSDELPGGWMRLHDAARLLDGRVMALVEWQTTVEAGVETEPGRLYAVDVQTGAVVIVDDWFGGWEEGSSRLHLAETGLIVGEYSSSITRSFYSAVIPGGLPLDTRPILPDQLGLEAGYDDCADCPQLYAIDRSGEVVAWIHGDDLVIRSLDTGTERRVPLDGRGAAASDIDIALQVDGDLGGPLVLVVEHRWSYDSRPAVVLVIGDAGIVELAVDDPDRVSL
jgi:hypothetical protein